MRIQPPQTLPLRKAVHYPIGRFASRFSGLRIGLGIALLSFAALACSETPERVVLSTDPAVAAAVSAAPPETAATPGAVRPRGLWVLCEGSARVLDDTGRVDRLIEHAGQLGATDLFVQVYRGGRAWYDATLADREPYEAILAATGEDTLARLIERAHARGIKVHAWVNVLSLSRNGDARIVRELGRSAVHVDRRGRSLLDYPEYEVPEPDGGWYRMGTRGVYLDPAAPGVAEWLSATFAELVAKYPELDGLHLDYIRHPDVLPFVPGSRFGVGLDFGYGELSRQRFQKETGLEPPFGDRIVNANRWDEWRRDKVTELVARIRTSTREVQPTLQLSAAAASHVDRAYLSMAQDWKRWLEDGLLDFAAAMIYTLDDRLFRYQVAMFAAGPDGDRIWAGAGTWLFAKRPARAIEQLDIARRAGAAGDALFSYDAILDAPPLLTALAEDVARSAAPVAAAAGP